MSADFFLDTNIIAYVFDPHQHDKRHKSEELVDKALRTGNGCISAQVIQEFLNLCTRKFAKPMSYERAQSFLREVLSPLCKVFPTMPLFESALQVQERWRYSFYDALVIAAALEAGCGVLYSEDLQHNQEIAALTICNPFREE